MLLGSQKAQKLPRWRWLNLAFWGTLVSSCAIFSSLVLDAKAEAVEEVNKVVDYELGTPAPLKIPINPSTPTLGSTLRKQLHPTSLTFKSTGSDLPLLQHQMPGTGESDNQERITRRSSEFSVSSTELKSVTENVSIPSSVSLSVVTPAHPVPLMLSKQADREITNGQPQSIQRYRGQLARGSAADLLRGASENVAQTDSVPREQQLDASPQEGSDPDLGTLRLQEPELPLQTPQVPLQTAQPKPEPVLHLLPRIGFYQTNNVFSGVDPVDDGLIFGSLTLWAAPKLGPSTYLTASVDGNLIRYINQSEFNYNLLRFRAGIRQRLTPQMYGEIGWNNQLFFRAEQGDRFLNDQTVYLLLSRRDLLTPRLVLDSYYDFRANFSDPSDRSRISNALYLSLSYYLQRNLQVGLDYLYSRSDFTRRDRQDQYHRIGGRVTYGVLSDTGEISVQGGLTVGNSSESTVDFDGYFFSVTYSIDLPIF